MTDQLIEDIRQWLRYHSDWSVTLDLWTVFGTIGISINRDGRPSEVDYGTNLDKRLAWARQRLHAICTDLHPNGERCTEGQTR